MAGASQEAQAPLQHYAAYGTRTPAAAAIHDHASVRHVGLGGEFHDEMPSFWAAVVQRVG